MKKLIPIIAILLTLTLLAGCAGGAKGAQKVAEKFLTAIQEEDFETAADCLHPGMLEEIAYGKDIEVDAFAEDFYKESVDNSKYELTEFEIVDVDIFDYDKVDLEAASLENYYALDGKDVKAIARVYFERKEERNGEKVEYADDDKTDSIKLYQIGSKWYVAETFISAPASDDYEGGEYYE